MKTILVVDDEPQIAGIVSDYLRLAGFDVIVAGDGVRALETARGRHPDLLVLDLGLPGLEVARALRKESEVPIIMLTARVEEDDRLGGLEIGADDYVTKPFSPRELVARVRAVLRRSEGRHVDGDLLRVADLVLDVDRMSVRRGDEPIDVAVPADLPAVEVDPVRIRQVLLNLLANALRHTPEEGSVAVEVEAKPQRILIRVRDTGSGIAPEDLPRIFERFQKGSDSRGSGLGLAIARKLVLAHGGDIGIESAPGKGTEVRVSLPR